MQFKINIKSQKTIIIIASSIACILVLIVLFFLLKPDKNYNKESRRYTGLLKLLSKTSIPSEEKDIIFFKIVNLYPVVRDIYAMDRAIVVEEAEDIHLPIEHQLLVGRKMFIDGHLVDISDVEDTIIPLGNKSIIWGYNIVPFRKVKVIFRGSLDLEEGRHQFRYVLDMKIVKSETDGPGESLYETSLEYNKEFTIINKLPENYISMVSYQGMDKAIELTMKVSDFKEESGFDPESGMEYQKLIINTEKPALENIASDIIAVKNGNTIGRIGSLFIVKGEKLENYLIPINLIKLGAGKHNVILKFTPNKELALQNARMRKIWNGTIQQGISFEIRKREVKNMVEEPLKAEKKLEKKNEQNTAVIKEEKKKEEVKKEESKTSTTKSQSQTTQTPATQPPATQPPATQPPATQPPATQPPTTPPPTMQPSGQ